MRAFNRLPFPYAEIADANRALRRDAVEVAAVIRSWSESARLNYLEAERLAKEGK